MTVSEEQQAAAGPAERARPLRRLRERDFTALLQDSGLFIVFIIMILVIGLPHPEFFSFGSLRTVLRQSALVGIMAFGMVFLVAMVEIDLSIGGIYAVSGTVVALLVKNGFVDPWTGAALGLLTGILLGTINGVLTSLLRVPVIIVSLGTLSLYFGLNLAISNGTAIYGMPKEHVFFRIFGGDFLDLPAMIWMAVVCGVVLHFVLHRTRFGATVRAIGSNPAGAQFIGVRTWLITIYATALTGFLAAISGIMTMSYFRAVDPSTGRTLGLQVIAAVVIGGTSLAGGSGTIIGTALGCLIITLIDSGLVFYGVSPNYSEFVTGIVIILAIALDRIVKRRRNAGA